MAAQTKLWYLQNFNLFHSMDMENLEQLSKKMGMTTAKKKQHIYFADQPANSIYMLKSGKVKIYTISDDGKTTTLNLLGPGEIFGESGLWENTSRGDFAEVVEEAVVCTLDMKLFEELIENNPYLNRSVRKIMGFRLQKVQSKLQDLIFKTADERVSAFIEEFADKFGEKVADGIMVRPFLSHKDIAELTATTRQTATTVLNAMAKQGRIKYSRRFLLLRND
jgi:CRP/FNR family cyclic AMP-dependent transcriptional regulator